MCQRARLVKERLTDGSFTFNSACWCLATRRSASTNGTPARGSWAASNRGWCVKSAPAHDRLYHLCCRTAAGRASHRLWALGAHALRGLITWALVLDGRGRQCSLAAERENPVEIPWNPVVNRLGPLSCTPSSRARGGGVCRDRAVLRRVCPREAEEGRGLRDGWIGEREALARPSRRSPPWRSRRSS